MNEFTKWALGLFLILTFSCSEKLTNEVPYPEGYISWTHVKTLTLKEKHPLYANFGGIHHVYVNPTGREALLSKSTYPDGSILVFDLLESESNDEVAAEGKRKVLAVMYKNSKAFPETKGWGFEGFKGNTKDRIVNGNHASCFGCHASQTNTDYTYSEYRE
jgi:hypothetical protein